MPDLYDVAAIGNAIVDVITPCAEEFLSEQGLAKGAMSLIDEARAAEPPDVSTPGAMAS